MLLLLWSWNNTAAEGRIAITGAARDFLGFPGISWWLVRLLSGEAHMKKIGTSQHFFRAKSTLTGDFHLEIRQKQGLGSLQSLSSTAVSVFFRFNSKLSCPSRLRGPLPDRGPIMPIIELNSSLEWTTAVSPSWSNPDSRPFLRRLYTGSDHSTEITCD